MQLVASQLIEIAQQVNAENAALADGLRGSLERAARIGRLLLEAKSILPHGQFRAWMEANIEVGRTQATKYMALAANVQSTGQIPAAGVEAAYVAIQQPKREAKRAPGPRTKVGKQRLEALKASANQTYAAGTLKACLRAVREFPDDAAAEIELVEELMAELESVIEQARARLSKAA